MNICLYSGESHSSHTKEEQGAYATPALVKINNYILSQRRLNVKRGEEGIMARELEGFRDQIMLIRERFPGQEVFNVGEVVTLTTKSRNFVKRHLMYDCNNICTANLARRLCLLK